MIAIVEVNQGPQGPTGPAGTTDYTQLVNVPATFPPSAHTHTSADITDATDDATAQPGKILRSSGSGSLSLTALNVTSLSAGSASISSLSLTTALSIANGGTGATTVDGARSALDVYSTTESDSKLSAAQLALLDPDAAVYQANNSIATADAADVSAFLDGLSSIGIRSSLVDAGLYQSRFQPSSGTYWKSLFGTANLTSVGSPTRHRNGVLFANDDPTTPTTPQRLHGDTPVVSGVWTIVTVALRDRSATTTSGQRRAFNAYQTAGEGGLALAVQMQNASNWSNYTFAGGAAANINGPQLPAEYRWRLNAMTNANPSGATSFASDVLNDSTAKQQTTGRGNIPIRHLAIGAGTTDGSTFAQYFDGMVPLWMIFDSVLTDAQLVKLENLVNRTIARRVKWVFEGDSISTSSEGWPWGLQTASEWLGRNIELKEVGLGGETTIGAAARIGKQGCRLFLNAVVPLDGETVVLNGETYTWKNTLSAARHVKIGASVSGCLANFKAAINGEAGEGTLYGTGTTANTTFIAVLGPAASLYLLFDADDPAVSVSETMTNGFLRNQISENITTTELMGLHSSIRDPLHPTWCLIQCGSNDPGDTANWQASFANLQSLWAAARAAGLKVVATTMPGATTFSGFWNGVSGDTIEQGRAALNAAIRAASSEYDALLDVDNLLTADGGATYWTDPAILVDGVHPSTASRKAVMNDLWSLVGDQMP